MKKSSWTFHKRIPMILDCFGIDKFHGFMVHSVVLDVGCISHSKMITLSNFQMLAAMLPWLSLNSKDNLKNNPKNCLLFIYSLLLLKNNIVFPPKLCQILPSLLVVLVYKTHSILASILEYKKCDLYVSAYSIHYFYSIINIYYYCFIVKLITSLGLGMESNRGSYTFWAQCNHSSLSYPNNEPIFIHTECSFSFVFSAKQYWSDGQHVSSSLLKCLFTVATPYQYGTWLISVVTNIVVGRYTVIFIYRKEDIHLEFKKFG